MTEHRVRQGQLWRARLVGLSALAWLSCSSPLLQKAEPLEVRYFAPSDPARSQPRASERRNAELPPLRVGLVSAASHLDLRLVSRERNDLIFHDTLRWSERPEHYLERGLRYALYEQRGLVPAVSGRAWTLNANLQAFERVGEQARVSIEWTLHDEVQSLAYATTVVERRVGVDAEPELVVDALSEALSEAIGRIADQVASALAKVP
jgi:hypothetical protein